MYRGSTAQRAALRIPHASILLLLLAATGCKDEASQAAYDSTPYAFERGDFPDPILPPDNELTNEKVALGRMLFYEPMLSRDGSMTCSTCHQQQFGFSDTSRFSIGVDGLPGKRQSMALHNLAWTHIGMFWDGRAAKPRIQALMPIQDPLEMHETLPNVVAKLQSSDQYRDQFIRAFGDPNVSSERISLAIEQFILTLVSQNSNYDKWKRNEYTLTDSEMRGFDLFFSEKNTFTGEKGGECFHCHGGFDFTSFEWQNNGLDDFTTATDWGRFNVTRFEVDKLRFKSVSLRNIGVTPPYMHDGRFATLEEVVQHYNSGVKDSPTLSNQMHNNLGVGLELSDQDVADIVAFLHTLTDTTFLKDTRYGNPF